ncbi:glutathione S-transferase [Aquirhabdus sp.]|uniref:glutathione S-transferase n=1 Tax=Aquirhabdus sp. TaxID=2824160 RepID=UPI00396C98E6
MQLIGMLDSPYVRRTAITLDLLGISFEHHAISVFSTFEKFQQINPVVKAPSLICDDGTVLMDSSLIIEHAEAASGRSLKSTHLLPLQKELQIIGLALAACEKTAQFVYEKSLRPTEKQFQLWLDRVQGQLIAAMTQLEHLIAGLNDPVEQTERNLSLLTSAVTWQFIYSMLPDILIVGDYPALSALSANAEQLPVFKKYPPVGPGVHTQA